MHAHILSLKSIGKTFPGVRALHDISFDLSPGEVLALVGENGAGKSTLLNILGGSLAPDEGEIWIDGRCQKLRNTRDAQHQGIGLIHQELHVAPDLTVAENVFLGRYPTRWPRWLGFTNWSELNRQSLNLLRQLNSDISPSRRIDDLSVAQKQIIEIARVLGIEARVLIFDEPTSSLGANETKRLLSLIKTLRQRGAAIIYVSHRLDEVISIADRVIVIRDGKLVGELSRSQANHERIITLMVGRKLEQLFPSKTIASKIDVPALEARQIASSKMRYPLSLDIHPGEIVGIAGLVGSGRSKLARAIFAIDPLICGEIYIDGKKVSHRSPHDAVAAGMGMVPEDRKFAGLFLSLSLLKNLTIVAMRYISKLGLRMSWREKKLGTQLCNELKIKPPHLNRQVAKLSGGNQQKIALGKWLAISPKVLLLDEPTRGVDIGAKKEIYEIISNLSRQGMAILLISSELEELMGLSHRLIVMKSNKIVGNLAHLEFSQESVMKLIVGHR